MPVGRGHDAVHFHAVGQDDHLRLSDRFLMVVEDVTGKIDRNTLWGHGLSKGHAFDVTTARHCSGSNKGYKQCEGDAFTHVPHEEKGLLKDMGWESNRWNF